MSGNRNKLIDAAHKILSRFPSASNKSLPLWQNCATSGLQEFWSDTFGKIDWIRPIRLWSYLFKMTVICYLLLGPFFVEFPSFYKKVNHLLQWRQYCNIVPPCGSLYIATVQKVESDSDSEVNRRLRFEKNNFIYFSSS